MKRPIGISARTLLRVARAANEACMCFHRFCPGPMSAMALRLHVLARLVSEPACPNDPEPQAVTSADALATHARRGVVETPACLPPQGVAPSMRIFCGESEVHVICFGDHLDDRIRQCKDSPPTSTCGNTRPGLHCYCGGLANRTVATILGWLPAGGEHF